MAHVLSSTHLLYINSNIPVANKAGLSRELDSPIMGETEIPISLVLTHLLCPFYRCGY